ncbi:lipid II flippase MurJ, partial [Rhodovulum sulfidophilum]|nr:lipid II flippase MurJ [Rhodovulum sulfidophilum]
TGRIALASALMGAILWLAARGAQPWLAAEGLRYPALAGLVALGIVSYFGLGHLLGAFRLSEFRRAMRRQR